MPDDPPGNQAATPACAVSGDGTTVAGAAPPAGGSAPAASLQELVAAAVVAANSRLAGAPEKEKKRDAWDVAGLIAGWAAALVIPVVLGVTGYYLNLILKNRESQTKMVELAIDMLKVDPKHTDEDKALRNWAMDVIDRYSEVKLPPDVRKSLETQPLDVLEGSATSPAARGLNRLKNRYLLPGDSDVDRQVTLAKLLEPGEDTTRFDQNRAATVTGFVVDIKLGGVSTANFGARAPDERDTNIELALNRNATANQRVLAVVTPRLRAQVKAKGLDWSTAALREPQTGIKGKRVQVTGWLLFNFMHANSAENTNPGNRNNWRATAWEIHPVTGIQVGE
jgi:hypothetical protein